MNNPVVKESLTTQPRNTPRTDTIVSGLLNMLVRFGNSNLLPEKLYQVQATLVVHARTIERELAAAIEQRDKLAVALNSIKNLHKYWQNDKEIAQYSVKMANEVLKELWKECGK